MYTFTKTVVAAVVTAGTLMWSGSAATAYFVSNYSVWSSMTLAERGAYAMGVFDLRTAVIQNEDWSLARAKGLGACVQATGMDSNLLAEVMDNWYKANPSYWDRPAFVAFTKGIEEEICGKYVDAEMEAMGLTTQ